MPPLLVRGRLVATPIPDRLTTPPVTTAQNDDGIRKLIPSNNSAQQSIDASILCPGSGPFHFRPTSCEENKVTHDTARASDATSIVKLDHVDTEDLCSLTRLDIYLYNDQDSTEPSMHLLMNRYSSELVSSTLQRVLLNIARKLKLHSSAGKKRISRGERPALENQQPKVWTVDHHTSELMEEIEVAELTNEELWKRAKTSPMVIQLQLSVLDDRFSGKAEEALQVYNLLVDACPPTITAVQTFEDFRAWLFVDVPIVVQVETIYASNSRVDWFLNGQLSHITVADGRITNDNHCWTPKVADVGKELSILVTPMSSYSTDGITTIYHNGKGCEEAYHFLKTIEQIPENTILRIRRPWLQYNTQPDRGQRRLRIVTYNILAHQNAFSMENDLPYFPYVSGDVLHKGRRLPMILHEILAYRADLICMQEVDDSVFRRYLEPVLTSRHFNYQGYYAGKDSVGTKEGCAIFWSLRRFHDVDPKDCKLYVIRELMRREYDNIDPGWQKPMDELNAVLERHPELKAVVDEKLGHIVQMVPLVPRSSDNSESHTIWTVNTHLFYHPQASHIRLLQMFVLARQLGDELQKRSGATVICGDFNSSLVNSAGKLLLDGLVPKNFRDNKAHLNCYRWSKETQPKHEVSTTDDDFPSVQLPDSFPKLYSAMEPAPLFTHYVHGFSGVLDHILHSKELKSKSFATMPAEADVTIETAMPSTTLPSDHVSVVCDFDVNFDE